MQLMPAITEQLGVRDVFDARQNIEGGVRHLRRLLDRYGDFRLALAAYNAGEKVVESHGGVPPIRTTRNLLAGKRDVDGDGVDAPSEAPMSVAKGSPRP
jgi:soluble lytic murein transglycosylase-like protein